LPPPLIFSQPRDSGSPGAKGPARTKNLAIATACATALLVLAVPASAYAAFFGLFSAAQASAALVPVPPTGNSQTMALLVAPDGPVAEPTTLPLSVVDGTALLAAASTDGDAVAAARRGTTDQISVYEVRPGDTLSEIGEMYGVSANTIKWGNDLKGPITPGQRLVILPITGVSHAVVKGDTVASIAKKYGADADEIRAFNEILGDKLAVGQVVIVPDGEIATVQSGGGSSGSAPSRVGIGRGVAASAQSGGILLRRPVAGVKTQGIHGHNGIDIGAPAGAPVAAAAAGTVIVAKSSGWNGGYGLYVVVDHGYGVQTLYSHLSSVSVSVGQTVSAGNPVGAIGSSGKSTGNHLHFEVRGGVNPF